MTNPIYYYKIGVWEHSEEITKIFSSSTIYTREQLNEVLKKAIKAAKETYKEFNQDDFPNLHGFIFSPYTLTQLKKYDLQILFLQDDAVYREASRDLSEDEEDPIWLNFMADKRSHTSLELDLINFIEEEIIKGER